jgi:hypothetical protein
MRGYYILYRVQRTNIPRDRSPLHLVVQILCPIWQAHGTPCVYVEKTLSELGSDAEAGLTSQQVEERLQQYGSNELEETAGRSKWEILLDQFKNIMLVMLIAVAVISGVLDLIALQQGKADGVPFKDTIAILLIVILNGVLGYLQESRAEKALAALKSLSSPKVRVIRDGRPIEIDGKATGARGHHAIRSGCPGVSGWASD